MRRESSPDSIPDNWKDDPEGYKEFSFVHSPELRRRFLLGGAERQAVIEEVGKLERTWFRNEAWYKLAQTSFENDSDIKAALELSERISNPDEKVRFRVYLAMKLLEKGDMELADSLVGEIGEDRQGYLRSYREARAKLQ
jgi:hypothetical protein